MTDLYLPYLQSVRGRSGQRGRNVRRRPARLWPQRQRQRQPPTPTVTATTRTRACSASCRACRRCGRGVPRTACTRCSHPCPTSLDRRVRRRAGWRTCPWPLALRPTSGSPPAGMSRSVAAQTVALAAPHRQRTAAAAEAVPAPPRLHPVRRPPPPRLHRSMTQSIASGRRCGACTTSAVCPRR